MNEDFERELTEMAKPEVTRLGHEDLLAKAIAEANKQTTVNLWWLSIPIYIVASFLMKLYFVRGSTFSTTLMNFFDKNGYTARLLLIVIPLVLILTSSRSLRSMYLASNRNIKTIPVRSILIHCFFIVSSFIILLIYVAS